MLLKNQSTIRKKKNNSEDEYLDSCEVDDEGFIEGDVVTGKVLSRFSFGSSVEPQPILAVVKDAPVENKISEVAAELNQPPVTVPRGITPPVNGEYFNVKRSYQLRSSTVRKLNELKAAHPDVNVLFNTIVDMAISHYYNYIIYEKGSFIYQEEKKLNSKEVKNERI